jgi:hypothetical protein
MAGMKLTLALSHYDRHLPLLDGSLDSDRPELQVLIVGQSAPLKLGRASVRRRKGYLWRRSMAAWHQEKPRQPGTFYGLLY